MRVGFLFTPFVDKNNPFVDFLLPIPKLFPTFVAP